VARPSFAWAGIFVSYSYSTDMQLSDTETIPISMRCGASLRMDGRSAHPHMAISTWKFFPIV
jgi:hypothetical protein